MFGPVSFMAKVGKVMAAYTHIHAHTHTHQAVDKIHAFLSDKLAALLAPNTNVRILQQHLFVRYGFCFRFLQLHAEPLAVSVYIRYKIWVRFTPLPAN